MAIAPERIDALSPHQQVCCARDNVGEALLSAEVASRGTRRWFPTTRNLEARNFSQRFEQHADGLRRCTDISCGAEVKAYFRTREQWLRWEGKRE